MKNKRYLLILGIGLISFFPFTPIMAQSADCQVLLKNDPKSPLASFLSPGKTTLDKSSYSTFIQDLQNTTGFNQSIPWDTRTYVSASVGNDFAQYLPGAYHDRYISYAAVNQDKLIKLRIALTPDSNGNFLLAPQDFTNVVVPFIASLMPRHKYFPGMSGTDEKDPNTSTVDGYIFPPIFRQSAIGLVYFAFADHYFDKSMTSMNLSTQEQIAYISGGNKSFEQTSDQAAAFQAILPVLQAATTDYDPGVRCFAQTILDIAKRIGLM